MLIAPTSQIIKTFLTNLFSIFIFTYEWFAPDVYSRRDSFGSSAPFKSFYFIIFPQPISLHFMTLNNVTERGHNIQKWDIINWSVITCVCDSKYFKKNPRRNDLPFLKDPAIDIITTGYALTSGWNMIFSKFSIFSSNPWEFLPSLTSCVIRIICRGSPLSVIVIILLTVITVGVIKVRNKGKGIDCY